MKTTLRTLRAQRTALPDGITQALPSQPSSDDWMLAFGIAGKAVLTIDEVAALLRVSERTIRERIRTGDVPAMHIGRRVLIPVPQLVSLLLGYPPGDER
jgi:excisionase family DNA binding protein